MKSVSSSELRAVLPSSAFAKCYDSVKIERERAKCVYGCAINVCTYVHQNTNINTYRPTPPHIRGRNLFSFFFFFFGGNKQYDCEYRDNSYTSSCISLGCWKLYVRRHFVRWTINRHSPRIRIPWTRQFLRLHQTNWKVREGPFLWHSRVDCPRTTSSTSLAFFVRVLWDRREVPWSATRLLFQLADKRSAALNKISHVLVYGANIQTVSESYLNIRK